MKEAERTRFFKRALLVLWATATLILLFSLILIVQDLMKQGYNPLPAPPGSPEKSNTPQPASASVNRNVSLYFADANALGLVREVRELRLGPFTQDNCRTIVEALIEGPRSTELTRVLPRTAKVRNVFLLDNGELVIDFSREIQTDTSRPKSANAESLMVFSIASTLAQPSTQGENDKPVRAVRLLFEGSPFPATFPEHLDFSQPFTPDPSWLLAEKP